MSKQVWVNGKYLDTSQPKASQWAPPPKPEPKIWGVCPCGAIIFEGQTVWAVGDLAEAVCFDCRWRLDGKDHHCDCAGITIEFFGLANEG